VDELVELAWRRFGTAREDGPPVSHEAIQELPAAINVGLESFYDSLVAQGAQAVQVDWKPPAGGNEKLASLLARMK
jgi:FdrA protein